MWKYQQEVMGTSDPDPEPRVSQCPYAVFEYPCGKTDCAGCPIKIEAGAKANEDREIAENMRDYWKHLGKAD